MEFDSFQILDTIEFNWVYDVDGLIDLAYHVLNPHNRTKDSIVAIERYANRLNYIKSYYSRSTATFELFEKEVMDFIDKITSVSWYWTDLTYTKRSFIENKLRGRALASIKKQEKKSGVQLSSWPKKQVSYAAATRDFYELAKQHVKNLLQIIGAKGDKPLVIDQPFAGNDPQAAFPYFDEPYAIIVDRDPRDNYIFLKTKLRGRNHFAPVNDVRDFVKYFRGIRDDQPYKKKSERILRMRFEDMVYDYDNATAKLRGFLGLGENPRPKTVFDPALSIANTQTFLRFKNFDDDVKYIEEHLTEYLFDFSPYPEPDLSGEMFFGKSPLNRK
ncbi:MAG: hypothetical protein IK083_00090 [Abditibacteriota bacterium]|nr:hypothetical protein [Abditibacteriota bacterium]